MQRLLVIVFPTSFHNNWSLLWSPTGDQGVPRTVCHSHCPGTHDCHSEPPLSWVPQRVSAASPHAAYVAASLPAIRSADTSFPSWPQTPLLPLSFGPHLIVPPWPGDQDVIWRGKGYGFRTHPGAEGHDRALHYLLRLPSSRCGSPAVQGQQG